MLEFSILKSYTSDELFISFSSDSKSVEFREALKMIMEPQGFNCEFDENHIYIDMTVGGSKLEHLIVTSDEWCVSGTTNTFGKNKDLNKELITWLKDQLINSGCFKLRDNQNILP